MEVLKYTDLTPDEREFIDLYRQLDEIQQQGFTAQIIEGFKSMAI